MRHFFCRLTLRSFALCLLLPVLAGTGARAHAPKGDAQFARLLALLSPAPPTSGYVFSYLRRTPELADDIKSYAIVTDIAASVLNALIETDEPTKFTGVDFARITAVLSSGDPGQVVLSLLGAEGFAARAPAILAARGYKRSPGAEAPACSMVDPSNLDEEPLRTPMEDPFGLGVSSGYCLSTAGELAVVAHQTGPLKDMRLRLVGTEPCALCQLFGAMAAAQLGARGGRGEVILAMGFTLAAHAGVSGGNLLAGLISGTETLEQAKARIAAEMAREKKPIPPHMLALLSVARGADGDVAQISLAYPDGASADAAAPKIRDRLQAFIGQSDRAKPGDIRLSRHQGPDGTAVVVLTLAHASGEERAALREQAAWIIATIQRNFSVLDPLQ